MDLTDARIVVIGGAGLVGSHVVDQLLGEPVREVVVFDNLVRGTRANLAGALESPKVRLVEGSMTDPEALRRVLAGADGVFLLASLWLGECLNAPRQAWE
ncbi:MAG TPA: NAD-dependent epimerase/dehydratase family protein, partial [Vicinamibacteria bacterium]|nr:NAD-dependent epimerase/dehydratase family protein [Vicinamibacteria bacterium]